MLEPGRLAESPDLAYLPAHGDARVLTGSLVRTAETSLLLGVYDHSGRELVAAA
jgi:hypothetical protein